MSTLDKLSAHLVASMVTPSSDAAAKTTADRVSGVVDAPSSSGHSAVAAFLAQKYALRMAGRSPR